MSLIEMQACIARLYVDEPFRRLFSIDGPATLAEYVLTPDELAAVEGIDRDLLELYAASLKNKRRQRIERAYPLLFSFDRAETARYYSRFYQLYTAKPRQSGHQDVVDFGTFMEESLAGAEHLPPYASELARYERMYYCMSLGLTASGEPDDRAADDEGRASVAGADARPYLRLGVGLAAFAYDVAEFEEALHGGASPEPVLERRPCFVAFRPATRTSAAKTLRLNAATKTVLDACDGSRTVPEVVAETERILAVAGVSGKILEAVDRLLAEQVLVVSSRGAAWAAAPTRAYGTSYSEGM